VREKRNQRGKTQRVTQTEMSSQMRGRKRERESERERNASHLSDPFLWLVRLSDKL
jgi:hypothetical protein